MGKVAAQATGGLNRLLGKTVCFQGKFDYGVCERLRGMAEAQQALVTTDLDATVNYLVIADLLGGKTVQKKATSLNSRGASIVVMDADAFGKMVEPTPEEIMGLLRGGAKKAAILDKILATDNYYYVANRSRQFHITFSGEDLRGVDLSCCRLDALSFDGCDFTGATATSARFASALKCDFSGATATAACFENSTGSRFAAAKLEKAEFGGDFSQVDFTSAMLDSAQFSPDSSGFGRKHGAFKEVIFRQASLRSARFMDVLLSGACFDKADLAKATFVDCKLPGASFREANLQNATLVGCRLVQADFTNADLRNANLADADLSGASLAGAELAGCNLRGAKLDNVDLSLAKGFDSGVQSAGAVGPALTELDQVAANSKRLQVNFHVRREKDDEGEQVGLDTSGMQYGWGIILPSSFHGGRYQHHGKLTVAGALLQMANLLGARPIRYETLEVSCTKGPKPNKELRGLVMQAIAEAFAQPIPPEAELTAATKVWRERLRDQQAADRERRELARKQAEKEKESAKKQIAKKIAKEVGQVTDIATFLKALELRCEKPKIQKATSMLKASRFQLYNDVTDSHLTGVVKSQTDPDLVYACRIDHEGNYACCTQNLNVCGGLRGSICKHLLVLIIGLVKAGELDPSTIDAWIARTHSGKPELNKETMGEIFIRYKGAEAGEVDWRPTQTLPEDYYAL